MTKPHIIFFCPDLVWGLHSGVIESQVLEITKMFEQDLDTKCSVFVSSSDDTVEAIDQIAKCASGIVDVIRLKKISNPLSNLRYWSQSILPHMQEFADQPPTSIYFRSVLASLAVRKKFNEIGTRTVLDIRGISAEEKAFLRGKPQFKDILFRHLQYREMRKADRLLCVSNALAKWIKRKANRDVHGVVPACVDTNRFMLNPDSRNAVRRSIGWQEHHTVFLYAGGIQKWQRMDGIIALFKFLAAQSNDYRFVFLVRDTDRVRRMLAEQTFDMTRMHCQTVPPESVPQWLDAADVGVILRHDHPVNNVASPIKCAEYLAAGLRLIATDSIGDITDLVREHDLGWIVKEKDIASGFANLQIPSTIQPCEETRRRIKRIGAEKFDRRKYLDQLCDCLL